MFLASFRTNVIVVVALAMLAATLFLLGAGDYTATSGLIKTGGWLGIVLADSPSTCASPSCSRHPTAARCRSSRSPRSELRERSEPKRFPEGGHLACPASCTCFLAAERLAPQTCR